MLSINRINRLESVARSDGNSTIVQDQSLIYTFRGDNANLANEAA